MSRDEPHPFLTPVREATRELHAELEKSVNLRHITGSRAGYTRVLEQFHGLWKPLEALLAASPVREDRELNLEQRFRAGNLERDLRVLSGNPMPSATLPWLTLSLPQSAGILYVLEGSTHGGAVISKHLRENLGIGPESGGSFFAGHGAENGAYWQAFVKWAEASVPPAQAPEAAAAARDCFQLFIRWFGQP